MKLKHEWFYHPLFSQDKPFIKEFRRLLEGGKDPFLRDNPIHFCANALVLNRDKTHVLMIYHRIFDSWSLPGGHADGQQDLMEVGKIETREETGLAVEPFTPFAIGWDLLKVKSHWKGNTKVEAHQHLVGTYLYLGDDNKKLVENEEEAKGVQWISISECKKYTTEEHMIP